MSPRPAIPISFLSSILILWTLLIASLNASQNFNPAAEFSGNSNPNGPWTYGYTASLTGPLPPHKTSLPATVAYTGGLAVWRTDLGSGVPAVWYNPISLKITSGTLAISPGELVLHPGPNSEFGLLRFTAPLDGTYKIIG